MQEATTGKDQAMNPCTGNHIGTCTIKEQLPLHTKFEAEAKLDRMGYRFNEDRAEWVHVGDGRRGRLAWFPDYCNPETKNVGTRFWLMRPGTGGGEIEIAL
jgi:hypothetical protein